MALAKKKTLVNCKLVRVFSFNNKIIHKPIFCRNTVVENYRITYMLLYR